MFQTLISFLSSVQRHCKTAVSATGLSLLTALSRSCEPVESPASCPLVGRQFFLREVGVEVAPVTGHLVVGGRRLAWWELGGRRSGPALGIAWKTKVTMSAIYITAMCILAKILHSRHFAEKVGKCGLSKLMQIFYNH